MAADKAASKSSFHASVTRLGNLLHFGQLFKACGNNYFFQIDHIFMQFFKAVKALIFLVKSFVGNFQRHLATFYWSLCFHRMGERERDGWMDGGFFFSIEVNWVSGYLQQPTYGNKLNQFLDVRLERILNNNSGGAKKPNQIT